MANWNQITQDLVQKYRNTFVRVKLPPREELTIFMLKNVVAQREGPPELTLVNPKDGTIVLKYVSDSEIYFDYPDIGYFFHQQCAMLCFRRLDRNWTRGFSQSTAFVTAPYGAYVPSLKATFDFPLVESAYAPFQRYSLRDAVDILKDEKCISVPLSREFALGQDLREGKGRYLLWYLDQPIGEYEGMQLHVHEKHFRQEVFDYLKRTNQGNCLAS